MVCWHPSVALRPIALSCHATHHSSFKIRNSKLTTHHSSFKIRNSTFVIRNSKLIKGTIVITTTHPIFYPIQLT